MDHHGVGFPVVARGPQGEIRAIESPCAPLLFWRRYSSLSCPRLRSLHLFVWAFVQAAADWGKRGRRQRVGARKGRYRPSAAIFEASGFWRHPSGPRGQPDRWTRRLVRSPRCRSKLQCGSRSFSTAGRSRACGSVELGKDAAGILAVPAECLCLVAPGNK